MKKTEAPVSDALVDAYRDILKLQAASAQQAAYSAITPGAGVDPRKAVRPGKRLRNWHRANRHGLSLRQFVRAIAAGSLVDIGGDARNIAKRWLDSKAASS